MFEWLAELTRETLYLNTSMHISGNNELIIDNCRRIEEYNEVYMRLVSGSLCISIHGNELRAFDFKTGGLVIRGTIEKIEFSERSTRNEAKDQGLREDKRTGEEAL